MVNMHKLIVFPLVFDSPSLTILRYCTLAPWQLPARAGLYNVRRGSGGRVRRSRCSHSPQESTLPTCRKPVWSVRLLS
jgi:hypothetical protein